MAYPRVHPAAEGLGYTNALGVLGAIKGDGYSASLYVFDAEGMRHRISSWRTRHEPDKLILIRSRVVGW